MTEQKVLPIPKNQRIPEYWNALNNVLDPELGIGIVDLGLVYDIEVKDKVATVTMTLTSMGCPVGPSIMGRVRQELELLPEIDDVVVDLVWHPAWNRDMVDPDIQAMMFV